MARTRKLSFLNLTCRFGDKFVLLDLTKELLIPALFNRHIRSYGKTHYFFTDVGATTVSVAELPGEQIVFYGRFIKDTVLTRNQIYQSGVGLISDQESIQSSPSSIFALILNNHKLVFAPEVPYAPSVDNLTATLQSFIGRERESYVRALRAASLLSEEPKSLSYFFEQIPPPEVIATPMASSGSVAEFVRRFAKITNLTIKLIDTNAEFPTRDLFRMLRATKEDTLAKTTSLVHESTDGLRKEAVISEVGAAASGGNQKIVIRGVDEDGARLVGDNEHVKFQVEATDLSDSVPRAAEQMTRIFGEQVGKGRLSLDTSSANGEKLEAVREALPK